MRPYKTPVVRRMGASLWALVGVLSLQACQLTTQEPVANQGESDTPVIAALERTSTVAVSQALPKVALSEKHFIIPVARSGDFAPQELDDYVLRIIGVSRQWDSIKQVEIHGHTDSEGSELSNMLLSIRRANRVAERFEALGVEAGLLLIEAHGETQALADNTTLDGRIANRRIEVVLIGRVGEAGDGVEPPEIPLARLSAQGDES